MPGAEAGPRPGVVTEAKDFFAELVGGGAQLFAQGADGVVLVVEVVAEQQEFPFLGAEQKHQAHHHGQGRFVQNPFAHVGKQLPSVFLICFV